MTLYQSETFLKTQKKNLKSILKILDGMESKWRDNQKSIYEIKIKDKLNKAKNQALYTNKLLQLCKSWKGPATSIQEIESILQSNTDNAEKIVRTELSYYRDTHKTDIANHPELYKINKVSHEERLMNLCALLADTNSPLSYDSLPSNSDALKILKTTILAILMKLK